MNTGDANSDPVHTTAEGDVGTSTPNKRTIGTWLRVAASALLLGYVLSRTDWAEFFTLISNTRLPFLALSLLLSPVVIGISVWKWSILLRVFGIEAPFHRLFLLYLLGGFFSNFLPSNVGGDVVRAAALGRSTSQYAKSASSVFMERYTGLTALVLMALLSVPLNFGLVSDPRILAAIGVVTGGYTLLLLLVIKPGYLVWLSRQSLPGPLPKWIAKALAFQSTIHQYRHHPGVLVQALAISVLWNLVAALNVYLGALTFGQDPSFATLVVTVPIILTVAMLPITFGGLGLTEWAFVFAFTHIGESASAGLSVALLIRFKALLADTVGGAIYATGLGRVPSPTGARTADVVRHG